MCEERISERITEESAAGFTGLLKERIKNYQYRKYEKNGYVYFKFSGYAVKISIEFYQTIKKELNE
ncbi:MAG: hypothetical protein K1X86_15600 [Ignavibacteria bacterium]|nr:hypothetical protein [Ignavibacteria bacterium]